MRHTLIEQGDTGDNYAQQFLKISLHTQILRLMFLKPLPVVVCRQHFQEVQYIRYIHLFFF